MVLDLSPAISVSFDDLAHGRIQSAGRVHAQDDQRGFSRDCVIQRAGNIVAACRANRPLKFQPDDVNGMGDLFVCLSVRRPGDGRQQEGPNIFIENRQ